MTKKSEEKLTPNSKKILNILQKSSRPMTAYEILAKMRTTTVKAPPTVYRALENLLSQKLVHRIHSLNAFIICSDHGDHHGSQFAVCNSCGEVEEIHSHELSDFIKKIGKKLKFAVESEALEIAGICAKCSS